ncbi:MAG: MoxR family ATPase [Spirochaetaceae bacterium]|jgi:MoxR-like ATPase|nr:MoxR family ATPase [Spirochaetaceae bacterium]
MERLNSQELEELQKLIAPLREEMAQVVVGQQNLMDRLLITLFCGQHILIEGVPGLAKTLSVTTLSQVMKAKFQRIQFTPDLLPADLLGTLIFNPGKAGFETRKGPVFTQILLADEINRAPAKVQSALLEAMQERQVTLGDETHMLPKPFMVLATQNPLEQEGTYPLPEAQMDRFMLKVKVSYPNREEELTILRQQGVLQGESKVKSLMSPEDVLRMRGLVDRVFVDPKVEEYLVDLVRSTREPELYGREDLKDYIQFGASPRASLYLSLSSKALALLRGRDFVTPQDIKDMAPDVLRHRLLVSYEAEAEGMTSDDIISGLCESLQVP